MSVNFWSKYAAMRQRALKLTGRPSFFSFSRESTDFPKFPTCVPNRSHVGPLVSLSESGATSEINVRDCQHTSPTEPNSTESELRSGISDQNSNPHYLEPEAALQGPAANTADNFDITASNDFIQYLSDTNRKCGCGAGALGADSAYCLSPLLKAAVDDALQAYKDMLQEHSLDDQCAIEAYLAQCSLQSLEDFFVTASDAKNAASLRRSAILHDVDHFLLKIVPLVQVYQNDFAALGDIEESIDLLRREVNKHSHRRVDLYNLESRLPGDTRFPPSFMYTHQDSQTKVEEQREKRPMARYFSRQFIEDGYAINDQDFMSFWKK